MGLRNRYRFRIYACNLRCCDLEGPGEFGLGEGPYRPGGQGLLVRAQPHTVENEHAGPRQGFSLPRRRWIRRVFLRQTAKVAAIRSSDQHVDSFFAPSEQIKLIQTDQES